jgi:hypothetical protein
MSTVARYRPGPHEYGSTSHMSARPAAMASVCPKGFDSAIQCGRISKTRSSSGARRKAGKSEPIA